MQFWPASTHRTAALVVQDLPEVHSCVCIYQQRQHGDWTHYKTVIYKE